MCPGWCPQRGAAQGSGWETCTELAARRIQALGGVGLQGYRFKESCFQYLTSHPSLVLGRAEWVVPAGDVSQSRVWAEETLPAGMYPH